MKKTEFIYLDRCLITIAVGCSPDGDSPDFPVEISQVNIVASITGASDAIDFIQFSNKPEAVLANQLPNMYS